MIFFLKEEKMNKKILLILIIMLSIFTVSNVSAANDSNIASENLTIMETQVSEELDVNEPNTHYITPESNLQDTIDQAAAGDTIVLNGTFEIKNTININKTINIQGNGNVATIKPTEPSFQDMRLINIQNSASNVVLSNLKLYGGKENDGAAILWEGSAGSINNCEIIQNTGKESGTILLKGNNCKITDSTFKANKAQIAGAILIEGDDCQIVNCTFNENSAYKYGGAILIESNNCLITECTFKNNFASQGGGAIVLKGKGNTISNSKFNQNYLRNYENGSDISGGGAIFSSCEITDITNCSFNGNNAPNLNGGAINLIEYGFIQNSNFKDNTALFGNAIYCNSSSVITSNYFVIQYNESNEDTLNISEKVQTYNNIFNKTKISSSVDFSASMIFEYGASGSIHVIVDGGTVKKENIRVLKHKEAKITYSKSILTISGLGVGSYILRVTTTPDENHTAVDKDLNITVKKANAVISASKLTVALNSASIWSIKIINSKTHKPIPKMKLTLKVYTGKKYKTVHVTTNSKGVASYKTKGLSAGTHKIVVSGTHSGYKFNTLTSSIKVIKQTALKFKLQARTSDRDGAILSYIVSNKKTNKGINGIKIKFLIYTGKKYKTFVLKTKKIKGSTKIYNGAIGFATNEFSAGTHKVKILPYDLKYKGSATSSIVIKKSAAKGVKFFRSI